MMRRSGLLGTALLTSLTLAQPTAADQPRVVASILPLGGIAAAVMDGLGEPHVLLEPGASPHAYSLRPTQAQAMSDADLILWIGPDMETFLERPIVALGGNAKVLELSTLAGIELLPYREGVLFEGHSHHHDHGHDHDRAHAHDDHAHTQAHAADGHAHDHDHAHAHANHDDAHDHAHAHDDHDHDHDHEHAHAHDDHDHDHEHAHAADAHAHDRDHAHDHAHVHDAHDHDHGHAHGDRDGHIWLSPAYARIMADAIALALAEIDPGNAERYKANASSFAGRLDAVEAEIEAVLEPVRGRPFIVFHDAYHYFERHFAIPAAGSIYLSPDVQPGAARVAAIQARLGEVEAACVFAEPQFEPRVVRTVIEGSDARKGVLDPLGAEIGLSPHSYPALLQNLAASLADCLAD